jgi:hypothetical protein
LTCGGAVTVLEVHGRAHPHERRYLETKNKQLLYPKFH